jgi:hypothetical protein
MPDQATLDMLQFSSVPGAKIIHSKLQADPEAVLSEDEQRIVAEAQEAVAPPPPPEPPPLAEDPDMQTPPMEPQP